VIDTHAHLDQCAAPVEQLLDEARAAGVHRVLTVGREEAVALAERYEGVQAIVGIHPHEAGEAPPLDALRPLLTRSCVVALGECGLDWYRNYAPRDDQLRVFRDQIGLANELRLPLVVHTRAADDDTFRLLEAAATTVVLHCFGSPQALQEAIERGYYCSFAGNVTYRRADDLREAARRLPLELLLAETDAPFLAPEPRRGRPNTPAAVVRTLAALAELRGMRPDALERAIERNAATAFGLDS
jgi:TatD DNase family protein